MSPRAGEGRERGERERRRRLTSGEEGVDENKDGKGNEPQQEDDLERTPMSPSEEPESESEAEISLVFRGKTIQLQSSVASFFTTFSTFHPLTPHFGDRNPLSEPSSSPSAPSFIPIMGLSIAQLPPLTPTSNENSFNTAATADTEFKVLVKPPADAFVVVALTDSAKSRIVAKADSIDYFLADVMPTGV